MFLVFTERRYSIFAEVSSEIGSRTNNKGRILLEMPIFAIQFPARRVLRAQLGTRTVAAAILGCRRAGASSPAETGVHCDIRVLFGKTRLSGRLGSPTSTSGRDARR